MQPRNPRGRKLSWIVQEKSEARLEQGEPAGLSTGKSAERENPKAVQHRAKQLPQSGRSKSRPVGDGPAAKDMDSDGFDDVM
ncbi:hypothetical protein GCM10022381_08270 [Leifsonia kafniensis]|uniref:Uncharacterized protein n=1 Tax=Leifsonia kafniensis TaxID=475957 RepID=A0ABP7K7Y0_9MICO